MLLVRRVEGEKERKEEDSKKIELTREEIYEAIGVCLETNENKLIGRLGEISPQEQWKVVRYMKSKNKDNKRLSKRGIEEEKR